MEHFSENTEIVCKIFLVRPEVTSRRDDLYIKSSHDCPKPADPKLVAAIAVTLQVGTSEVSPFDVPKRLSLQMTTPLPVRPARCDGGG